MEAEKRYKTITKGIFFDNLFIYLPFWFPLLYLGISLNNPLIAPYLFLTVLFLFAETHFASTWLFFFDSKNRAWVKRNFYKVVVFPLYLIILFTVVWKFNPSLVIILHYIASGFHVTRQSIGIVKLSNTSSKLNFFLIYSLSIIFLIIGLFNPGIFSSEITTTEGNAFLLAFSFLYLLLLFSSSKKNYLSKLYPIFTGIFIYAPLLFFKDRATATAIGVGMHWCQYIVLMAFINFRKLKDKNNSGLFSKPVMKRVSFVFIYSFFMTSLTYLGMPYMKNEQVTYSTFYLFPILFQLYHFYLDGYIWRFSDPHIKSSIGKFIFNPKPS